MQRKKDAKHKCVMHTLQKLKEVIPLFLLPRPATTYSRILEIQKKNSEQKKFLEWFNSSRKFDQH